MIICLENCKAAKRQEGFPRHASNRKSIVNSGSVIIAPSSSSSSSLSHHQLLILYNCVCFQKQQEMINKEKKKMTTTMMMMIMRRRRRRRVTTTITTKIITGCAVAHQCYNGDVSFLWKNTEVRSSVKSKPLSRLFQNLSRLIISSRQLVTPNLAKIRSRRSSEQMDET